MAELNPELNKISATESGPRDLGNLSGEGVNGIQKNIKQILNQTLTAQFADTIPKSILNILKSLNSHFASFDLINVMSEAVPRLKSYVDNSGIFLEKMLETVIARLINESEAASSRQLASHPDVQTVVKRDLKANLLVLKNFTDNEAALKKAFDGRSLATLRKAVDVLLADISGQQDRAVKQRDSAEPFQVFTIKKRVSNFPAIIHESIGRAADRFLSFRKGSDGNPFCKRPVDED